MVTLTRNINAKIFQIKTLSYLSIRVEGYKGTGVRQCYSFNRFNHTVDNCHTIPRCLKCGEAHQTKDCPIQRVDSSFCINYQVYSHMANYSKYPLFPKTRKGIKNPTVLEEKIEHFTAAVRSAHQFASKPIANTNHAFTPNYIRNLIRDKNRAKKQYNNTLNPVHKQLYYRLQEKVKKELKKHSQQNWKIN
ncbi:hypothetical protein TNCV_3594761 [Trichonephila clavipes]|nr:hypothetical protein TNCV_3594761 [Trichonephila clavipes]